MRNDNNYAILATDHLPLFVFFSLTPFTCLANFLSWQQLLTTNLLTPYLIIYMNLIASWPCSCKSHCWLMMMDFNILTFLPSNPLTCELAMFSLFHAYL